MYYPEVKNSFKERNIDIESIVKLVKILPNEFRNCKEGADVHQTIDQFYKVHGNFPYNINSFNLIGEEINHEARILALGCSVTASAGIPHQLTWPHFLRKMYNTDVNVLASLSLDIMEIVRILNIYLVSENFRIPDSVYILAPDILRTKFLDLHNFDEHKNFGEIILEYNDTLGFLTNDTSGFLSKKKPARIKDRHLKNFTPSVSYTIMDRLATLELCVTLCKTFGVNVVVSSWDMYTQKIFQEFGYIDKVDETNCFSSELRSWEMVNECPKHNFEIPEHLQAFWNSAIDGPNFHPGLHHHVHYVENLLQKDINYDVINELDFDKVWLEYV